jgi:hypothetical protein
MQCLEFESRLHAVLDERRDPATDASLADHAAFCEPCSDLLAGQFAVLQAMNRLKRTGLAPEKRKRPVSKLLRPVLALAAAMLLALGVFWQIRERNQSIGEVARGDRPAIHLGPHVGTLAIAARGVPTNEHHLRMNGGDWLLEAPRLPHHLRAYRGTLGQLAISLPTALNRLDQVDQYAPGLSNLRASFDMFWHTLVPIVPAASKDDADSIHRQPTTRSHNLAALVV